jgi:putative ABC transport system permease protein
MAITAALASSAGCDSLGCLLQCRRDGAVGPAPRGHWSLGFLVSMWTLIRFHRAYLFLATGVLATAVGVNLVVFTIVNALWLRPLPFPDPDRVITIVGNHQANFDHPSWKVFEAVAGQVATDGDFRGLRPQIRFDEVGRDLETLAVTSGYFRLFGLAIRGRDFTAEDDSVGAEPVAIISDRLWSQEFGRRAELIGSVISARPVPIRIIGVAPPGFEGARRGERADIWIPARLVPRVVTMKVDISLRLMAFARLFPGDTAIDAERRFKDSHDRARFPGAIVPLKDVFGSPESRSAVIREGNALRIVAGLAMLVLAGGCATLAALVLVHYERRRLEFAVRLALGASRPRLVGELSRELATVAVAGVIGAVVVADLGVRAIPPLALPSGVELGRLDLSLDWRVLGVAVAATALTLLAAAWLPVSRFTRARRASELFAGPAATASIASQRFRQALLGVMVCASIIVLISAGLFVRAVVHGFRVAPGFDVDRTLFASFQVISVLHRYPIETAVEMCAERTNRVREALRFVPGIDVVADGSPPIRPEPGFVLDPRVVEVGEEEHELQLGIVYGSADLLSALGVPIVAGRGLTVADSATNPVPVVITSSLAMRLWPDENPLGQVLRVRHPGYRFLIVGIARDFVFGSLIRPATGVVVTPINLSRGMVPQFVIRTAHPEALADQIQKVALETLPEGAWADVRTGREVVARELGRQRLGAWFLSGFGLTALILSVGGVFGLVAYLAESRQRECGVRLALGATTGNLVRHALAAALVPVSIGVMAGVAGAAFVSRLFASLLTGLSPLDPLTYAVAATATLCAAGAAGLAAAWRMRRMMPSDALRTN